MSAARTIIASSAGVRSAMASVSRTPLARPAGLAPPCRMAPARLMLTRTYAGRDDPLKGAKNAADSAVREGQKWGDSAKEGARDLENKAEGAFQSGADKLSGKSHEAKRAVEGAGQDASNAANDAKKTADGKAKEMSRNVEDAADSAEGHGSGIVDNVKGAVGKAKDGVEDTLESGKDKVMEAAEGAKDGAANIKEKMFGN